MNTQISLLASSLVVLTLVLAGCDSATATNDKKAVESKVEVAEQTVAAAVAPVAETAPTDVATAEAAKPADTQAVVNKTEFKEGVHYFEIFPQMQTDAPAGKVEVVELMWLGCPHCFNLEPTIEEYKKSLPDYVAFKQVPAMLNPRWSIDAKTFYIAELLDPTGEKKLIPKIFNAIHVQRRARMSDPGVVKDYLLQQGISETDYNNAVNSMALQAKLSRAQQISADSQAQSVPSIIINGKYRTSPYAAGDEKKLLEVIDMLTERSK